MNKAEWKEYCHNKYILLDGATGSNLMKAGMPVGVCPEKWILDHPQTLIDLQKAYVAAGSNIIYAPTFTANRVKLQEYGLYEEQASMIQELVELSKKAADGKALIAGDITMTGKQLAPVGSMQLEELIDIYKEQIILLEKAGVDLLAIETMMSLAETRAAVIAAKEVSELPVLVTMTFEPSGRTLFGSDAKTAAIVLESLGVDALGVNCSTGPADMANIIREMAEVTSIPLIAKPNAGMPAAMPDGSTAYNMSVEEFVVEIDELIEAGAEILGGCCGTDPSFIKALYEKLERKTPKCNESKENKVIDNESNNNKPEVDQSTNDQLTDKKSANLRFLTSERKTLSFGLNDRFIIVGERINPTGKKLLQADLRDGNLNRVLDFVEEQEACGAEILDINLGMSGIDEKAMMLRVLEEVQGVTNLPLSLDSSHVDVLEAALRHYPGRALVNSVSYETEKIEKLLPIVKKYGAMFILLPLSDNGLPKSIEEKQEIIEKVCERAFALGMKKEDIIVDGLVTTIGANPNAAAETLQTIRYCREKGLATICGLSNISFGMPARTYVNSTFLTLAIQAGLTMAIANPNQELLVVSALATDLLLSKEGADLKYVEFASTLAPVDVKKASLTYEKEASSANMNVDLSAVSPEASQMKDFDQASQNYLNTVKDAVLKGNRSGIAQLTRKALDIGISPQDLLNHALLPAITLVGEYFDKKKYFLPQLIAGAEAMKNAIQVLEPLLASENRQEKMPVIVVATVEGDIHDIGKNLVAMMLKNHGYQVIDLGKDVPAEVIVNAARENNAKVIGLSALMTTTMQRMRDVVNLVKETEFEGKIMIGGAVITPEYAEEIHADAYAEDAADAVRAVKKLLAD